MKGYSAFTKDTGDMPDVVVTPKMEEIRNDIEEIKKDMTNPKYSPEIIKKFKKALNENQAALVNLQKAK